MLTATPALAGSAAADWLPHADAAVAARTVPAAQPAQVETAHSDDRLITFVEPGESFLSLSIRNFGLTLATLGFYSFWARAEARQKLHRSIRIAGQPLDYTGTGRERFIAFLLGTATTVVLVSAFVFFFVKAGGTGGQVRQGMAQFRYQRLFITLPLLFLLGSVVYRKRKEILRRTWWRGQHFDLDGVAWAYALQHFWTAFLVPLTLGWAGPWRASRLEARKINEMHHGTKRFAAVGGVSRLYAAFAALWFGGGLIYLATMVLVGLTIGTDVLAAIEGQTVAPLLKPATMTTGLSVLAIGLTPVLGFVLFYRAAWIEHQISSLEFDGRRLGLALPKLQFAGLMLWNGLVKFISFGAFTPVADAMLARFVISRITSRPV
jgi:uncharacterized membrane protein YjgN (DUF898 family)